MTLVAISILTLSVALVVRVAVAYRRDIDRERVRTLEGVHAIPTPWGQIEYAETGSGPPVVIVHGTSGGHDQGLEIASGLAEAGFRVIAPSRFGYLGSAIPEAADPDSQADAFANLLNHLAATPAAIIGISAGSPSATAFALRYPQLCRCLVLIVPAFPGTSGALTTKLGRRTRWLLALLLRFDVPFWAIARVIPSMLASTVLATERDCYGSAAPEERTRALRIVRCMLPVTRRRAGILLDARWFADGSAPPFPALDVPLLTISCEDDRLGTAQTARAVVHAVRRGRAVVYPNGGHVLLGHHTEALREVASFIRNAEESDSRR